MPKTINGIFGEIVDFENLYRGFKLASKGKRNTSEVINYAKNLEENIINTQNHLIWHTYRPKSYTEFYVFDPKKRLIQAPDFYDRVVHHALVNVIEPILDNKFIHDSYACRCNKGTHKAVLRVHQFQNNLKAKSCNFYVLKADISKYFQNIDIDILKSFLRRSISCKDTLWLIDTLLGDKTKGLPIGALTSQLFANVYLNYLDHYIKDDLGIKFYVRYMDDFIVLHNDKLFLRNLLKDINIFLKERLRLTLNSKTQILSMSQGIDFCGYRIWPTHILPRKRNVKRFRKNIKILKKLYNEGKIDLDYIKPRIASFLGYMKHCKNYTTLKYIFSNFVLQKE